MSSHDKGGLAGDTELPWVAWVGPRSSQVLGRGRQRVSVREHVPSGLEHGMSQEPQAAVPPGPWATCLMPHGPVRSLWRGILSCALAVQSPQQA